MRIRIRASQVLVGVAVLAFGAVAAALVAQYQFDMQPCLHNGPRTITDRGFSVR